MYISINILVSINCLNPIKSIYSSGGKLLPIVIILSIRFQVGQFSKKYSVIMFKSCGNLKLIIKV